MIVSDISPLQRQAGRAGVVEHEEEKAPGRPCCGLPVPFMSEVKEGEELFIWTDSGRTRGNGFKLNEGSF